MFRLLAALGNAFKIPELRKRILFTLGIIAVYEVGIFIPAPGIDGKALGQIFDMIAKNTGGGLLNLLDMFTGGALSHATIFALGIMPYISATIIVETLLATVIPAFVRWRKEGMAGYRRLHQVSRYVTILLAVVNSFVYAMILERGIPAQFGREIVQFPGWGFRLLTVITMTSGMAFIMWLAEQITERGIGNGMSLLMTVSIVGRIPLAVRDLFASLSVFKESSQLTPLKLAAMGCLFVSAVVFVIFIEQAQRRVPVQYARRMMGRKIYGGQTTYLPLKVNSGGVLPIIFAVSVLAFPGQVASFFPKLNTWATHLTRTTWLFNVLYAGLIVFFAYFSMAITSHGILEMADNMKKSGAFIPGIRQGESTVSHLDFILVRITFVGALYLVTVAILPDLLMAQLHIPPRVAGFFGGTSLLIVVGVMLDTMKQIESHLLMRHYEGFMKRGQLRGRR